MATRTSEHLATMLRSRKHVAGYAGLLVALSVFVALVVTGMLRQHGIAFTTQEQVLDCQFSDVAAHTHNSDCYDNEGNLVCPLPEIEQHVHDDSCYTQEQQLVCGQEESDGHTHTDDCYQTELILTCGKEEILEEHVHGPGCFRTVDSADDAATATAAGQSFEGNITDEHDNVLLKVNVEAPEGALPEGSVMRIEAIEPTQIEAAVDEAVSKKVEGKVEEMQTVGITFLSPQNEEVIPTSDLKVTFTSELIKDTDDPLVVSVDEQGEAMVVDALTPEQLIERDETPVDNELKLEQQQPYTYAIVSTTLQQTLQASDGNTYAITVDCPASAGIPANATLAVEEVLEQTDEYDAYFNQVNETLSDNEAVANARFFDISILDAAGEKIQPSGEVAVTIKLEGQISTSNADQVRVAHFADNNSQPEDVDAAVDAGADQSTVSFAAESFSVYSVYTIKPVPQTDNLSGKSFVIMNWNSTHSSKERSFALTADAKTGNQLYYARAWVRHNELVYSSADTDHPVALWTFTQITEPDTSMGLTQNILNNPENKNIIYSISTTDASGQVRYLSIDNKGALKMSGTPAPLRVSAAEEGSRYEGMVMIGRPKGMDKDSLSLNLYYNGRDGYFRAYSGTVDTDPTGGNYWQTLFEAEEYPINVLNEKHEAEKVSADSLINGDKVVVYQTVWNKLTERYDVLAIAGDGTLVPVVDNDSSIGWFTAVTPTEDAKKLSAVEWTLFIVQGTDEAEDVNYWLYNADTETFLTPSAANDGSYTTLKWEGFTPDKLETEVASSYSVHLPGKDAHEFDSAITSWSREDGTQAYYYEFDDFNNATLAIGPRNLADQFNFARTTAELSEETTPVKTLDSAAMGITMRMFDYPSREWMSNSIGADSISQIDTKYWDGGYVPGLLERKLNASGMPVSRITGPMNCWFDSTAMKDGATYLGEVNHLFLQSVYSETGYFEYNSALNYAYLNDDGNFTVYDQIGAPNTSAKNHGNFMPLSKLLETCFNNDVVNSVDEFRNPLAPDNPRKGDLVHQIDKPKSGYNFNFGLSLEAEFIHPANGTDNRGNPIVFEFSGDDDFWLFVDDVLVLDLGGIHSAISGSVNFQTGEVTVVNGKPYAINDALGTGSMPGSTIKECFKNAGVFPDGTTWSDDATQELIDKYFNGETLRGNIKHKMKVFYTERGKNASNLHMRFNLRTTQKDAFLVEKQLSSNTDTQKYFQANVSFPFQVLLKNANGTYEPVGAEEVGNYLGATKASYNGVDWADTNESLSFTTLTKDDGTTYENVFYLAPNEAAWFHVKDSTQEYFVREIKVDASKFGVDKINDVEVTDVEVESEDGSSQDEGQGGSSDYESSQASVSERNRVTFINELSENHSKELRITKVVNTESVTRNANATFTFKVSIGVNELKPYCEEKYYLVKANASGAEEYYTLRDGKPVRLVKDGDNYCLDNDSREQVGTDPICAYSSYEGYITNVPEGYTVVIKDMMSDMQFAVSEPTEFIPSGYTLKSISCTGCAKGELAGATGKIIMGNNAEVTVTNEYKDRKIRIVKVDIDNEKKLQGARFTLYDQSVKDANKLAVLVSDNNGVLTIESVEQLYAYSGAKSGDTQLQLPVGTYYLVENKAPSGYEKLTGAVCITMDAQDDDTTIPVRSQQDIYQQGLPRDATWNETTKTYDLVVVNSKGTQLPQTGGMGTLPVYLAGGTMMVVAALGLLRKQRPGRGGDVPCV